MQSLMYKYIEDSMNLWRKYGKAEYEDRIEDIFAFLSYQVQHTGNYFTELVDIAVLTKNIETFQIRNFRFTLKAKILEQRGEIDGQILIDKFM